MEGTMKKLLILMAALALLLAACGEEEGDEESTDTTVAATDSETDAESESESDSDSESDADDDEAGSDSEGSADSDDGSMDEGSDDEASMEDGSDGEATEEDGTTGQPSAEVGDFIETFFAQTGAEVTPEILDCLQDRDIDTSLSLLDATEEETEIVGLGLFACAPEELAPAIAFDIEAPEGTTAEQVECVVAETFRYVGTLPTDEALVALDSVDIPEDIRAAIVPIAVDQCGIDEGQAEDILSAT
jgi:hypothetical protein